MPAKRSPEELKQALVTQRGFLAASCKAYDDGNRREAFRIATVIHTLVHDYGEKTKSVLRQLGVKGKMRFVASAPPASPENIARSTMLVWLRIQGDGTAEFVPILDNSPHPLRSLQFDQWWTEIVMQDGPFRLSRKNLVFALRNQEGGAHFDDDLPNPNYVRFSQEQISTPFVTSFAKAPTPVLGAELATMRQIAWELEKTISDHGPL